MTRHQRKRDTVGVYLRLRPTDFPDYTIEKVDDQTVKILNQQKIYRFTHVFDKSSQSDIYNGVARPVVEDFITKSKNGLVFTYGITGSGKTYTMEGDMSEPGLIYRTTDFLFNSIASQQTQTRVIQPNRDNTYSVHNDCHIYPNLEEPQEPMWGKPSRVKWQKYTKETGSVAVDHEKYFCVFMSLIELYNRSIYDLFEDLGLDKERRKREIREDSRGVSYVANAVELEVKTAEDAKELYKRCVRRRKTGATALNQESSRGHLVLNFKLVQVQKDKYTDKFDEDSLITSQLSLVDLAGSERTKRTGATGEALNEACNINNSLGALRKCIKSLREPQLGNYPNYRTCSLTRLFKSYFEGQGNVCMILCVNPTPQDYNENAMAMDFGIQTQDVAIDYASPPKILKKSRNRIIEDTEKIMLPEGPTDPQAVDAWLLDWLKAFEARCAERKRTKTRLIGALNEFRSTLVASGNETEALLKTHDEKVKENVKLKESYKLLESKIGSMERSLDVIKKNNAQLAKEKKLQDQEMQEIARKYNLSKSTNQKLESHLHTIMGCNEVIHAASSHKNLLRASLLRRESGWLDNEPTAPQPFDSSSPMLESNQSTPDGGQNSTTPPQTSDCSSNPTRHDTAIPSTNVLLASPTNFKGVAVINPRHNRSLSCSSIQWIHHRPSGTVDTGTVLKPKFRNGRSVKKLKSKDILDKEVTGYSVIHQDADPNGELETSVYKGDILPTICGGKQVILNDIETMTQESPKTRKRAISDVHG